ncbi:hypothetical protein PC117_g27730, partial [Phytophthora cactorum]
GLNPVFCLRLVRDGASNDVLAALIKRRQKPRREANTEVTSASQPESRNPLLSKAPGETASVGVKATNRQHNIQERLIAADRTGETELHARKRQPLKVLTDCPTRWDSARDLLARMVDLKQPLKGFHRYLKSTWVLDPIAATSELLGGR